jgi:DNA-directed RNA polymerase alpha subunit
MSRAASKRFVSGTLWPTNLDLNSAVVMEVERKESASGALGFSSAIGQKVIAGSPADCVRVRVLDDDGIRMRMLVGGECVDPSFMNAWRRAMMGEVDTLAIDQLEIHENTSMTPDEQLFHRLGMVPLRCRLEKLDKLIRRSECDCDDGCDRCAPALELHVINKSDETVEVTTADLFSYDKDIAPVSDRIVLAKLHKNQELAFTAKAIKSTAKPGWQSRTEGNAKWSPVVVATYKPIATVTVNAELLNKHLTPAEQRRVCADEPAGVLHYNEQLARIEPHPDAALRCTYVGDFIESLADILHPPDANKDDDDDDRNPAPSQKPGKPGTVTVKNPATSTQGSAGADAAVGSGGSGGSNGGSARVAERERLRRRGETVGALEQASAREMRHPTDLVHPMISMVPRRDEFLMPVVSAGGMTSSEIALRGLAALRKRLLAIQMLCSQQFARESRSQPQ